MAAVRRAGIRGPFPLWAALITELMAPCDERMPPPPPPEAAEEIQKEDKLPDGKRKPCFAPQGGASIGIVSLSFDCDGFTIQGGEGAFIGITRKIHGPSGKAETTLFGGIGADVALGDHVKGEAKATISITQADGKLVDVGAGYTTGAKAEGYGSELSAETGVGWSLRGGPQMDFSGKAAWRGNVLAEAKL